ncbi:cobalt-precorrin-6A synthase [Sulfolobus acidocaldarius SUSAZ]|nr:cobalt-precorrin-6A synthase [Sulfolobus acidocaldarius SUSAZ]
MSTLKRFGITTGATAAAASKASVIFLLKNETPKSVTIPTPIGLRLEISVGNYSRKESEFCASAKKFSGDNPDILDGLEIIACSGRSNSQTITITAEEGVGTITRPGLKGDVGDKSISPIAKQMIIDAVKEVVTSGVYVKLYVPKGEELARNTMNPLVGVEGGISILGTTGIEYPVSDEDYIEHIKSEACVVKSTGNKTLVLAPGNTSFKFAREIYGDKVIKIGDNVGSSLKVAEELGFSHAILVSLPGKLVKVAAGMLNTHSKFGDARLETLTFSSVVAGISLEKIQKIVKSLSISEGLSYLTDEERQKVMKVVSDRALEKLKRVSKLKLGIIVISEDGKIMAKSGEV